MLGSKTPNLRSVIVITHYMNAQQPKTQGNNIMFNIKPTRYNSKSVACLSLDKVKLTNTLALFN